MSHDKIIGKHTLLQNLRRPKFHNAHSKTKNVIKSYSIRYLVVYFSFVEAFETHNTLERVIITQRFIIRFEWFWRRKKTYKTIQWFVRINAYFIVTCFQRYMIRTKKQINRVCIIWTTNKSACKWISWDVVYISWSPLIRTTWLNSKAT